MPLAEPKDDLIHEPAPHGGWRESYYFDIFDEKLGLGMWHSIGKKPYKGYSGFTLGIWGQELLCGVGRDRVAEHTELHRCEGLAYECLEPLKKWRITYKGHLMRPEKRFRLDPKALLPDDNDGVLRVPVEFDLIFIGTSPTYRYEDNPLWRKLFDGHLDQTGRTTGTLTIGEKTYTVDGLGARDRSWGTRDWLWPRRWRFVHVPTEGMNMVLWYAEGDDGTTVLDGFLEEGGRLSNIVHYSEQVQYRSDPEKPVPTAFEILIGTADGRRRKLEGDVLQIMPVVFSKELAGKRVFSWNDRSLVRYRLPDGTTAYGNIEFAERVEK